MRGPGAKLQQTETRGRVREDSLGWREGAMKGWARNRERQRGLVGAQGFSQEEHTVNSFGWAERHGNRAGVADRLGAKGVRWGAGPGSGPGTKL